MHADSDPTSGRLLRKGPRALAAGFALTMLLSARGAGATIFYDGVQIAGSIESQQLFRVPAIDHWSFVQQRNTIRLEYEQALVKDGKLLDGLSLPFVRKGKLAAYYRFAYDSIYDIAPGGFLRAADGSIGGKIGDLRGGNRSDVALENVLREIYVDLDLADVPVSLRIGRYQLVWGNTYLFRTLDSINALDLSWHFTQEFGFLGRSGFSELRIPAWTVSAIVNLPELGPLGDAYLQLWDIPFDFQQTEVGFFPAPWGLPYRNPFRPGLVVDGGATLGLPPGVVLLQPCFDSTGSTRSNGQSGVSFAGSAESGRCDSPGLQRSRLRQGLYGRHDPADVNQAGARFAALTPFGVGFTLNYIYRRAVLDSGGGGIAKIQAGAVLARPFDFAALSPHSTTDPATRKTTPVAGFVRIPIEFYYPYTHTFGLSAEYADDFTESVWNAELRWTHGDTVTTMLSPKFLERTDLVAAALNFDRPTWIRWLNPRSTWLIVGQANVQWLPDIARLTRPGFTFPPVPELLRGSSKVDSLRGVEVSTLLVLQSFYLSGRLIPYAGWFNDWRNTPCMEFFAAAQYAFGPSVIVEPAIRIFYTGGKIIDDPWRIGPLSNRDELQLKVTYQF